MDATPEPIVSPPASSPGIFGTKIPTSVAFTVGVLLFFLPFAEIKCSGTAIAKNSGFGIAVGNEWQSVSKNDLFGNNNTGGTNKSKKRDPNIYAIVALGLGVLGLLLSLANARSAIGAAIVTGVLSAGALIGLMLDLQKQVKGENSGTAPPNSGENMFGLDKLNDVKMTVDFTPWFYIAVIAFLAAAFFSYRRIAATGKS